MFDQRKKRWSELSTGRRTMILVGVVVQFGLQAAALWDLRRRPAAGVRGPKRLWAVAAFVNFLGPVAYFVVGRRAGQRPLRRRSVA